MGKPLSPTGGPRTLFRLTPAALAALVAASTLAPAQSPQADQPVAPWRQTQQRDTTRRAVSVPTRLPPHLQPRTETPTLQASPPQQQAPPAAASPVIARIEGRDVTQADFDRIAVPYFRTVRAELGARFDGNVQKIATFNVLDELIRRELLAVEAQRQKIEASQAEIEAVFRRDPLFLTNGQFDPVKYNDYKSNPGSNYLQVLPRYRELAAVRKLDDSLRKRFKPTPAQVRAEWTLRNDQVRFSTLPLFSRDMSLEPEATGAELAQYYAAHPEQFMRKTRLRLRYARLPLPPEGDPARAGEEWMTLERATALADSLRAGTLAHTAAELTDSGLFEIPAASVPGLGRVEGLADAINLVEADSTIRVVGPLTGPDAVIVGAVAERQPRHLPPMREVISEVKGRADEEKRSAVNETERRAFYEANRERWRLTRASLTRVTLSAATLVVDPPSPQEVERWYAEHGRSLFGRPGGSKAWLPPITDSLRTLVVQRMVEERRGQRAASTLEGVVTGLRFGLDSRGPARAHGATAETLSLVTGSTRDTLFEREFVDSLLASVEFAKGEVQGPRAFGDYWAVWRAETVDTAYVQPYEAVKAQSDREFDEERRKQEEDEARAYFEQHRGEYKTPVKYALDYVAVSVPPPDSVRIPEAEIRRHYDANRNHYRQEEQVRARHILLLARDAEPEVEKSAKERADSLLAAIRKGGGDFADLARRFSQEPGAAITGGDLGWFGRGRMAKEFEEAAFALAPGQVSPVVKTGFGYHIIRLEDRKPTGTRPFSEVRDEIRQRMAQARGDSTARRAASSLARRLALGGDAKALAAPHGGVVSPAPMAAQYFVPRIGRLEGLREDLPGMTPGKWTRKVYRAKDEEVYVVQRVRETIAPQPAEFEEVKNRVLEDVKTAKRQAILKEKVETIRSALAAGTSLDSIALSHGGLRDNGFLRRTALSVPFVGSEPRVVDRAFTMKPGDVSDTLQVRQGVVWIRLEEKKTGDPAAFEAASAQIGAEIVRKKYDQWAEEKRKSVSIEILRPDLKGPRPSQSGATTVVTGS